MKKTILILAMALMSSCSTDETTNTDCNCGEVIQSTSFNVVNGQGGVYTFSIIKLKNNCTQEIIDAEVNGVVPVGTQYCN